jgi:hypothetical protein
VRIPLFNDPLTGLGQVPERSICAPGLVFLFYRRSAPIEKESDYVYPQMASIICPHQPEA